jgi:hypothetical protein
MPAMVDELLCAFRESEFENIGSGIPPHRPLINLFERMDPRLCVREDGNHYRQNQQSCFRGASIV